MIPQNFNFVTGSSTGLKFNASYDFSTHSYHITGKDTNCYFGVEEVKVFLIKGDWCIYE
jgi:hypothetical protein